MRRVLRQMFKVSAEKTEADRGVRTEAERRPETLALATFPSLTRPLFSFLSFARRVRWPAACFPRRLSASPPLLCLPGSFTRPAVRPRPAAAAGQRAPVQEASKMADTIDDDDDDLSLLEDISLPDLRRHIDSLSGGGFSQEFQVLPSSLPSLALALARASGPAHKQQQQQQQQQQNSKRQPSTSPSFFRPWRSPCSLAPLAPPAPQIVSMTSLDGQKETKYQTALLEGNRSKNRYHNILPRPSLPFFLSLSLSLSLSHTSHTASLGRATWITHNLVVFIAKHSGLQQGLSARR